MIAGQEGAGEALAGFSFSGGKAFLSGMVGPAPGKPCAGLAPVN